MNQSHGRFVLPGDALGTEEEYAGGNGTYMEKGTIYADESGHALEAQRTLSVDRRPALTPLHAGLKVIGRVENIVEPVALVVVEAEGEAHRRFLKTNAYCVLHASFVKRGYVKNVKDELRVGDIIRARVLGPKNGEFHITTEDPDCGVVKAFCCQCRHGLEKRPTGLQCPNCERRENRKLAEDYRPVHLVK